MLEYFLKYKPSFLLINIDYHIKKIEVSNIIKGFDSPYLHYYLITSKKGVVHHETVRLSVVKNI